MDYTFKDLVREHKLPVILVSLLLTVFAITVAYQVYVHNEKLVKVQLVTTLPTEPKAIIIEKPISVADTIEEKNPSISYIKIGKEELAKDIKVNYSDISPRTKLEILSTIEEVAAKYKINPLILYALFHTESSMRPWLIHKECIIDINGKKAKVQAIGLAAIIFELWGDKLIDAKIITERADLFDPILSINAAGYILNHNYKLAMHPKATSKDGSALLHYFGADSSSYFERIDAKVTSIALKGLYR